MDLSSFGVLGALSFSAATAQQISLGEGLAGLSSVQSDVKSLSGLIGVEPLIFKAVKRALISSCSSGLFRLSEKESLFPVSSTGTTPERAPSEFFFALLPELFPAGEAFDAAGGVFSAAACFCRAAKTISRPRP
ncbi:hypothetical protein KC19_3G052600, partial [Ceratodon purpureus]